ncbi:GGDEF domain-containing protein [Sulfurospirillum sp. 1307]
MKDYKELHVKITNEVKNVVNKHEIVFPAYYGKVYKAIAKKHNIDLSPEQLLHKEMLDEKIVRHIISLSQYTQEAIEAMEDKNEEKLKEVLDETKRLQEEIEKLQKLVYKDSLTKCYNREWFEDKYLQEDKASFSKDGVFVFVDLNRLKRINDDYGHMVGDKVIKYLALKLLEMTPNVVRYGGDEFILFFTEGNEQVEEKMHQCYEHFRHTKFKSEDIELKATFAYGLCPFKQGDTLESILSEADKKMYAYKEGNRRVE